ncbi:MAG: hypothetical protein U0835_03210 [Isosphaeraceae bacterium]
MRRVLLTLLCGFATSSLNAGELYYRTPGDTNSGNIYAVNENGGTPRVVLYASEYSPGGVVGMTRYNHVGSNGQALVQTRAYPATPDIELVFRAPNRAVISRPVTAFGANNTLVPQIAPEVAQDDSFFSFRAVGGGRRTIWRLNVTVDEALDPGYVPPTSFDDPRLQLLVDDPLPQNHVQTWSPDGTRMAYIDIRTNASGVEMIAIRLKDMGDPSTNPMDHPVILQDVRATSRWMTVLQWSPVSDEILNMSTAADFTYAKAVWKCYADSPGIMTWVALPLLKTTKTQSVGECLEHPLWRPDGLRIAAGYMKYTTTKSGTTREAYPATLAPAGWPVFKLVSTPVSRVNPQVPLGWTP